MTGRELFDRFAPQLLHLAGWEAQPSEVQQAWNDLASRVSYDDPEAGSPPGGR